MCDFDQMTRWTRPILRTSSFPNLHLEEPAKGTETTSRWWGWYLYRLTRWRRISQEQPAGLTQPARWTNTKCERPNEERLIALERELAATKSSQRCMRPQYANYERTYEWGNNNRTTTPNIGVFWRRASCRWKIWSRLWGRKPIHSKYRTWWVANDL